ncbi:MAG: type transport system permease protein [Gaiellaceae bacterium]|jgi:ABC-type transport system involved in multi-copper enzyme maturation permease subunit|nr:type transport system permease protein [Gaiellaceae bacterium]MDX6473586.1 type transport system permease protein [Gaiellaceae bacterium]
MSTVALPAPRTRTHTGRVTQLRVALSEWTKLRTLRSTRYTLFAGVALTIVFAVIPALVNATRWNRMSVIDKAGFHALETSLIGVSFAQLAFGVLGVLIISGEYSTGMIRSSFAAVPKRLPVLWAKAGIYGLVTLVLAVPSTLIAFFAAQAILKGHTFNGHDIALSFSDPGVARAVLGGALYLTLSGLFGLGLGAILRNTAAGISAFAAILFVLPPLMNVLPSSWNNAISPYLPSNAGSAIMQSGTPDHILAPWTGLGLFALYTAAAIAIAAIQLRRKDV